MQDSGTLGNSPEAKNSRPVIISGLADLAELKLTNSASWARMSRRDRARLGPHV